MGGRAPLRGMQNPHLTRQQTAADWIMGSSAAAHRSSARIHSSIGGIDSSSSSSIGIGSSGGSSLDVGVQRGPSQAPVGKQKQAAAGSGAAWAACLRCQTHWQTICRPTSHYAASTGTLLLSAAATHPQVQVKAAVRARSVQNPVQCSTQQLSNHPSPHLCRSRLPSELSPFMKTPYWPAKPVPTSCSSLPMKSQPSKRMSCAKAASIVPGKRSRAWTRR